MSPKYLSDIIPSTSRRYVSSNAKNIPLVRLNINFLGTPYPRLQSEMQLVLMYLKTEYYSLKNLQKTGCIPVTIPLEVRFLQDYHLDSVTFITTDLSVSRCCWFTLRLQYSNRKYVSLLSSLYQLFNDTKDCS